MYEEVLHKRRGFVVLSSSGFGLTVLLAVFQVWQTEGDASRSAQLSVCCLHESEGGQLHNQSSTPGRGGVLPAPNWPKEKPHTL